MAKKKSFKSFIEAAKKRDSYWIGKVTQDFTEDLYCLMEQRNVSKAELARRIGSSPAYVTKVLRGNTNFTVESMVRLARSVGGELCLHIGRQEGSARWFDVIRQEPVRAAAAEEYTTVSEHVVVFATELGVAKDENAVAA